VFLFQTFTYTYCHLTLFKNLMQNMYIAIIKKQTTQVSHHAVLQNEKFVFPTRPPPSTDLKPYKDESFEDSGHTYLSTPK
jgi:hypothetical protein